MYTRRVARPRELRPRHSVENQWDLLDALDIAPPDRVGRSRSRCRPTAPPPRRRRAARACRRRVRTIRSSSSTSAPAIRSGAGRSSISSSWSPTLAGRRPGAPHRRHVGPSEGEAAGARDRRRARPRSAATRHARVVSCGEFSLAELRALLDRAAALHRRRQRSAAHRRDDARADRRLVRADAAGAVGAVAQRPLCRPNRSTPASCPCRPCDQRVCEPGDFRCLTSDSARRRCSTPRRGALGPRRSRA